MSTGNKPATVGYKYHVGVHFVLCQGPVDAIKEIEVDEKKAWTGYVSDDTEIWINQPSLFGGETREGGVLGGCDYYRGSSDHGLNLYLQHTISDLRSAYRKLCSLVLKQIYIGTNPYLKPWSIKIERTSMAWEPTFATIPFPLSPRSGWHNLSLNIQANRSMNVAVPGSGKTKFEIARSGAIDLLRNLKDRMEERDFKLNISIRFFSFVRHSQVRLNAKVEALDSLIDYLSSYTANFPIDHDDDYVHAMEENLNWFRDLKDSGMLTSQKSTLVFLGSTDIGISLPGPAVRAYSIGRDIILRVREFSAEKEEDIDVYCYDIEQKENGNSADMDYLDNTGWDSTPIIDRASDLSTNLEYAIVESFAPSHKDRNPVHVIVEALIDKDWGMGLEIEDIDGNSFGNAAHTVFEEGIGVSFVWDQERQISELINEMNRYINSVIYIDRKTDKFAIKLIGRDQDVKRVFDKQTVREISNYRRTVDNLTNSIVVKYYNAEIDEPATLTLHNLALVEERGGVINTEIDYTFVSNSQSAIRLGQRDLQLLSTPRTSLSISVDKHTIRDLYLGDVIAITWEEWRIEAMPFRISGINWGEPQDATAVLNCIEDIFPIEIDPYLDVQLPKEDAPSLSKSGAGSPATQMVLFELPHYFAAQYFGESKLSDQLNTVEELGYVAVASGRPETRDFHALFCSDKGLGEDLFDVGFLDYCPFAALVSPVSKKETQFTLGYGTDLEEVKIGDICAVGNEMCVVRNIDGEIYTIGRGVLDSVPLDHPAWESVVFFSRYFEFDTTEYVAGEQVRIQLKNKTARNQLLSQSGIENLTLNGRLICPYPPGNVRFNGLLFPDELTISTNSPLTVSWSHRNRLQQTGREILDFTAESTTPEPGVTYTVLVYSSFTSDEIVFVAEAMTETTIEIFPENLQTLKRVRIELYTDRGEWSSLNRVSHSLALTYS